MPIGGYADCNDVGNWSCFRTIPASKLCVILPCLLPRLYRCTLRLITRFLQNLRPIINQIFPTPSHPTPNIILTKLNHPRLQHLANCLLRPSPPLLQFYSTNIFVYYYQTTPRTAIPPIVRYSIFATGPLAYSSSPSSIPDSLFSNRMFVGLSELS